jgi:hypothetical protein
MQKNSRDFFSNFAAAFAYKLEPVDRSSIRTQLLLDNNPHEP